MSLNKNYDDLLFPILSNEETVDGFFDTIFNFLYRNTDYFKLRGVDSEECGLSSGEAEKILRSVFCKYMQEAQNDRIHRKSCEIENTSIECVLEETVVTASEDSEDKRETLAEDGPQEEETQQDARVPLMDPDAYNGASYHHYSWSQSIQDLDVWIKVGKDVTSGKQVRVELSRCRLQVEVLGGGGAALGEELSQPINVEGSTWTLVPGEHIHVYLRKLQEGWWGRLLRGEPEIDLKRIDPSLPYEELDEDSRAKIQELMHRHHTGPQHPTKIQNILKEAWNIEGSPFKGQPFDPSIVNLENVSLQKD